MPKYSIKSLGCLESCSADLIRLFMRVIEVVDNRITDGHRSEAEQTKAYSEGRSQKPWPQSKHNLMPSKAVDAVPYPVDYGGPLLDPEGRVDKQNLHALLRFYHFAGIVRGIAHMMGLKIRWGGDWDGDFDFSDQTFDDLCHFEETEE